MKITSSLIYMTRLVELLTEVQAIRKFKSQNKFGIGASCEDHAITMNDFTATSQKQNECSKKSEAARDCPNISRDATELDMQLRILPEGAEEAKMVQALNLNITSPLDTTVFKNIRLPAWIRPTLPQASHSP